MLNRKEPAMRKLSSKIHSEINDLVEAAKKAGILIRVYAEAEKIRQANLNENVALEDIVEAIMNQSAHGPGFEANPTDALNALLGSSRTIWR
jgi:hypothetical protein